MGPGDVTDSVRTHAQGALAAVPSLVRAADDQIDDAVERIASLLERQAARILEANRADVEAAGGRLSTGLLDRLRFDDQRLASVAAQVRTTASLPPLERSVGRWRTIDGLEVEERRVPVGVIGAIYEARPNVTVDVATQLIKSRNAGVLRTGGASLRTAVAVVDLVISPALVASGLPAESIGLIRVDDHDAAEALVSMPELVPIVILRGSGQTTRHLAGIASRHGVRTLQHADGGGVLYVDAHADVDMALRLIRCSLDRLGVCNRLNWLLIDRSIYDSFAPSAIETLAALGITASTPPYDHPASREWALEPGHDATVTVVAVAGVDDALAFAHGTTSMLAASIVSSDEVAARMFIDGYRGTGAFWNATTRWLDGYQLSGAPETGINVDHVPGPRGPVTYRDLHLRQYVVTGDGTQAR